MRVPITQIGFLFAAACAAPAPAPTDWEYRVLEIHHYYGLDSGEDLLAAMERDEFMDHMIAAANRYGAEGWDFAPEVGDVGENRVLLRRSRSQPAAFKVQFVLQKELGAPPLESAEDRINRLVRDGWTLARGNPAFLEFHRPR